MVGFIAPRTVVEEKEEEEDHNQDSKSRNLKYPLDPFDYDSLDLSISDSFLDFDSIKEFFEDSSEAKIDFWGLGKSMETSDKQSCIETPSIVDNSVSMVKKESLELERDGNLGDKQSCTRAPSTDDGSKLMGKEERMELEREGNLGSYIEEEMGKVSLIGSSTDYVDAAIVKREIEDNEMALTRGSLVAASISVVPDGDDAKTEGASNETHSGNVGLAIINAVNNLVTGNEDESASDSESGGNSNSSSTPSSDSSSNSESSNDSGGSSSGDEEEEEEEELEKNDEEGGEEEEEEEIAVQLNTELEEGEMEEGEIRDVNGQMVGKTDEDEEEDTEKMVEWSDIEFDDIEEEEEGVGVVQGPIKSKNELKALPPVLPVDVALQPHHQMLPVGIVLSIIGAQVIVEGVEKHSPLNEGSILWITEKRSPLGLVDEIFGPVQNPYYVVRYNSESEVPAEIHQGTSISFIPEFAYHVLNEKNLYKKGYDASGENDEELSDDAEFSDDEKEAEHKRMQKMSKRGMNHQTSEHRRNNRNKVKNRNGNWNNNNNNNIPLRQQRLMDMGQQPPNQNQHNPSQMVPSTSNVSSSTIGKDFSGGASFFPPFPPIVPTSGLFQPSNGGWVNALPSQQPYNAFIPSGFFANNVSWPAQNQLQQVPFQQQFNPSQGSHSNGMLGGGQMNLCAGPAPWPAVAGQTCFNQSPFGIGFQMQPPLPVMNVGQQGMMPNEPRTEQNCIAQPPPAGPSNVQPPQRFNFGASSSRGRKPYRRGGGRFVGGRGGQSSK